MFSRTRFLKTCAREKVDRPPVWLMRQAGRHLPEYLRLREQYSILEMMKEASLIAEVSLQPWRRYQNDAVIVFSDILMIPSVTGMTLNFLEGQGPKFSKLISSKEDLDALKEIAPEKDVPFLIEGLQTVRETIGNNVALLGFAGSPWTVASYTMQNFDALQKENPVLLQQTLKHWARQTIPYLKAQIKAGCDAVQIFDSWGGTLSAEEYQKWSAPSIREIIEGLQETQTPVILFVKESAHLLEAMLSTGADVLSVGWETPLAKAKTITAGRTGIQGNLNPHILLKGTPADVRRETRAMLEEMRETPGYIANLGHGVLPKTPVENVEAFVEAVKGFS